MFVKSFAFAVLIAWTLPASAGELAFELAITQESLVQPAVLKAEEGDRVTLKIHPEIDGLLHLHGYGHAVPLKSGVAAHLDFTAQYSGRFPAELHGEQVEGHAVVLYLEVYPK